MRVASLPVPAVVGTAIHGSAGPGYGTLPRQSLEMVPGARPGAEQAGGRLGGVQHRAAADAQDDVDAGAAAPREKRVDERRRWFARHGLEVDDDPGVFQLLSKDRPALTPDERGAPVTTRT